MTRDLKEAQIVVGVATNECNSLLETIASSTTEVETKQTIARGKEQQLEASSWLISPSQLISIVSILADCCVRCRSILQT